MAIMKVPVRSSVGTLYGWATVLDPHWLTHRAVYFVRAKNLRYYGRGLIESASLDKGDEDLSFQSIEMKVGEYATSPRIGNDGTYQPGVIDFCLIWDGPVDVLRDIRLFEAVKQEPQP